MGSYMVKDVLWFGSFDQNVLWIGWMRKWPGRTVQRRAISMCCMKYYDTIFATGRYIAFLIEYSYFGDMFLWIMTLCYHTGWSACDSTSVGVRFQSKNYRLLLIACEALLLIKYYCFYPFVQLLSECGLSFQVHFILLAEHFFRSYLFINLIFQLSQSRLEIQVWSEVECL